MRASRCGPRTNVIRVWGPAGQCGRRWDPGKKGLCTRPPLLTLTRPPVLKLVVGVCDAPLEVRVGVLASSIVGTGSRVSCGGVSRGKMATCSVTVASLSWPRGWYRGWYRGLCARLDVNLELADGIC